LPDPIWPKPFRPGPAPADKRLFSQAESR